mmetsp:Transcript_11402/g.12488  ORF Transcript_11402/g.12488 Transcript_11402/m.12488 type:complete len:91 (+) Transcript_11402:1159-1431(+)
MPLAKHRRLVILVLLKAPCQVFLGAIVEVADVLELREGKGDDGRIVAGTDVVAPHGRRTARHLAGDGAVPGGTAHRTGGVGLQHLDSVHS